MVSDKWVVARLSALGDVVLATGVLDFWHRERGWRFSVITRASLVSIFKNHPAVDEVIGLGAEDLKFPVNLHKFKKIAAEYEGCGLIDLHGSLRTMLLSKVWKGKVSRYPKLGFARRLFLVSGHKLYDRCLLEHNVPQRYAMAVDNPPPEKKVLIPKIYLDESEVQEADKLLASKGLSPGMRLIALHPYATHPQKAWPLDCWLELTRLLANQGISWFVIGQEDEADLRFDAVSNGVDFTNKTDIRTTCGLLSRAKMLITADSGPMHLGTAVATPVLGLFGPTTRHWGFFPSGAPDQVLEADCPGRPFSLHGKSAGALAAECMRLISPEAVLEKILLHLNAN